MELTAHSPAPGREKIGEIYRLAAEQLSFQCSHCDDEFPLLVQFVEHIQLHLNEIFTVFVGTDGATLNQIHETEVKPSKTSLCQLPTEEIDEYQQEIIDIKTEPWSPSGNGGAACGMCQDSH